jgi:hypothetical protein
MYLASEQNSILRNPFWTKTNLWEWKRKQIHVTFPSQFVLGSNIVCIFCKNLLFFNIFVVYNILFVTIMADKGTYSIKMSIVIVTA